MHPDKATPLGYEDRGTAATNFLQKLHDALKQMNALGGGGGLSGPAPGPSRARSPSPEPEPVKLPPLTPKEQKRRESLISDMKHESPEWAKRAKDLAANPEKYLTDGVYPASEAEWNAWREMDRQARVGDIKRSFSEIETRFDGVVE